MHNLYQLASALVALRVFASDGRRLVRRLLGAGVRSGVAQLAREREEAARTSDGRFKRGW
jgi:hypothetical protein